MIDGTTPVNHLNQSGGEQSPSGGFDASQTDSSAILEFDNQAPVVEVPTQNETPPPVLDDVFVPPKSVAYQTHPYTLEPKTPISEVSYKFIIPGRRFDVFTHLLQTVISQNVAELEQDSTRVWRDVVSKSTAMYTPMSLYQDRLTEEGSEFFQGIKREDGVYQIPEPPKFKSPKGELQGELALLKMTRALGQGDVLIVQLPHSGINVTLTPPSERAVINFYNSLFREKISLGRMTNGLTLTNFSVHSNSRLFDFILAHVHSINNSSVTKETLREHILLADFYALVTGFAATMYPSGFEYQRPCIADDKLCTHVETGLIDLTKLLWVDNSALTEYQRKTLVELRPNSLNKSHLDRYRADHNRMTGRTVSLPRGLTIRLRQPTFGEYTADGYSWINGINSAVDTLIVVDGGEEAEAKAKEEMLQQYVKSSSLRQLSHFIDFVDLGDGVITHRDTLNSSLEILSADDEMRDVIFEAIMKYKSDTTIAVVGVPEYQCNACKADQNIDPVNDRLVSVIPLDVLNLFFTLVTLRLSRILER